MIFREFTLIYVEDSVSGEMRVPHIWKELRKEKFCQVYRTTGQPCSCDLCTGERYNRLAFKRETERILKEQRETE